MIYELRRQGAQYRFIGPESGIRGQLGRKYNQFDTDDTMRSLNNCQIISLLDNAISYQYV